MSAPFEKFEIQDIVEYSEFVVACFPRAKNGENWVEIDQREFIRHAIREKLEREKEQP